MKISKTQILNAILNFLLPPKCYACGDVIEEVSQLCPDCWKKLNFIASPLCACCGYPFAYEVSEEALCGYCIQKHPPYDIARATFVYDEGSKPLILKFKHGDALHGTNLLMDWLDRTGQDIYPQLKSPLVIPFPLHWTRLLKRMYNQSAIIGQKLAQRRGFDYQPSLLIRKKKTPYLGDFGREERKKILSGAFALHNRAKFILKNRDILLIDDVHTSGATLKSAARTLRKGGVGKIGILTLARVVNPYKI
ncbi:ComF family protein [Candidatus Bealeia paramacronuclearis]|uniref:ComF family protein n=1 Tax=Candidatus Bealeia paramacronuclearis TaxID=1921001 RepID=A0ABZ2C2Y7_9PROT|nr:ComF family protein [Candidatus Bealeia paramacronuclearis]